jgi:hypothetical protein
MNWNDITRAEVAARIINSADRTDLSERAKTFADAMQIAFIHQLAVFLVKNQDEWWRKSKKNEKFALEWRKLRALSPVHGHMSVKEAEEELRRSFSAKMRG